MRAEFIDYDPSRPLGVTQRLALKIIAETDEERLLLDQWNDFGTNHQFMRFAGCGNHGGSGPRQGMRYAVIERAPAPESNPQALEHLKDLLCQMTNGVEQGRLGMKLGPGWERLIDQAYSTLGLEREQSKT